MPRSLLLPLTAMILVAMALTMLASSILLSPAAPVGRAVRDGADVVQQFYAAVNETIATGNPADLQRVVAPHFVEENPLPGVEPGRTGLEDYVIALHDFVPGLRLVAEVTVVSAGQVVTRVDVQDDQISTVLPAALGERAAVWSAVEIFRVAGGVVVGRWGITDGLMLARPRAEVSLKLPLPSPRVVALGRVTIAPSARWDAPSAGPRLLYMNEGAVIVELAPGAIAGTTPEVDSAAVLRDGNRSDTPQPVILAAGRAWVAPAETSISMTNIGGAAAQLLMLAFFEPQIPNGAAPVAETPPVGVEVQVLAGDLATELGVGPVSLSLEQITLASKAGLSLSSAEGPILIAVEMGGQLDATTWGTAWVRKRRDGMSVASRETVLTTENGLLVQPGGMVALHNGNATPSQALVVAIQTDRRFR